MKWFKFAFGLVALISYFISLVAFIYFGSHDDVTIREAVIILYALGMAIFFNICAVQANTYKKTQV